MSDCTAIAADYRTLPGFSRYHIGSDGSIVSYCVAEPRVIGGAKDKHGYRRFGLVDDSGVRHYLRGACVVCEAWHGPRPVGQVVRHLDGSKDNDAAVNLAWGTQSENCRDKVLHGTAQRGDQSTRRKISEVTARLIKANLHRKTREIAEELGVSPNIVTCIRTGNSWRWL